MPANQYFMSIKCRHVFIVAAVVPVADCTGAVLMPSLLPVSEVSMFVDLGQADSQHIS